MKMKLILSICSLVSLLTFGQGTYKSFIHSGVTKWLYYSPQDACGMNEIAAYGDTIINQLAYKKLWLSNNYWIHPPYSDINQQWKDNNELSYMINAFVRQNSDSSKLYFLDGNKNVEYLIVDMNLNVGDEFTLPEFGSDTVKNIFYENGLKIIEFKEPKWGLVGSKLTFIESIGLNWDFTTIYANYGFPHKLICYSNSLYFFNSDSYACGCVETKTKDINTDKYEIKKLPNLIEISFVETAQRTWEIIDIYGRRIQKSEIINNNSIQIPITEFRSGIYLLRIYNLDNKEYKSLKINL